MHPMACSALWLARARYLSVPRDLPNGHDDVSTHTEEGKTRLFPGLKLSHDSLGLDLSHSKLSFVTEVLVS